MRLVETTIIQRQRSAVHPSIKKPSIKKAMSPADKVMRTLFKAGLLPFKVRMPLPHARALASLLNDIEAACGSSGALSPMDLDRGFGGTGSGMPPPTYSVQWERINSVMKQLQKHEVDLLIWLRNAGSRINISLTTLGRERCGIDEPNRAQGAATGVMMALAHSIYEHYPEWREGHYLHERGTKYLKELDRPERYTRQKVPEAA